MVRQRISQLFMNASKAEETKKETVALMEALINGGIKVKSAAEVGKRAVEYTRGDEISNWILNNKQTVAKLRRHSPRLRLPDRCRFYLPRAIEGTIEKTASGTFRRPMWPKRLIKTQKQRFDKVGFYIISYEGNQRWNYVMLTAMILGIFAVCMFQTWPLALKLGMWYISVVLLTILISLLMIRLVLFVSLWFCGFDFWIFPNLLDEELGVFDSFKPLYNLTRRTDTVYMLCCRVLCAIMVAASIHELGKTHDLKDVGNFARQSFLEAIEWGRNKLTAVPEETPLYKSIGVDMSTEFDAEGQNEESGEEGLDDDDYKCLLACGYRSLGQLLKECMLSCNCMEELLANPCLSGCPEDTIRVLTESKTDICRKTRGRG
ncbi:Translocation protein Sec62, putative [Babesia bigemina]|uniref:Translocation protein SEC62 n=1 Tax=Babesia bigemina TaxID=5866 RepID=A0A061D8G0_BABBI|nr:Translocation protein Sec62, putative [Babesia bigemina]CDR96991.1 Translocation protein Sec62, putative [Babesia bigemina]|eukprot:XP_012769177.1 Translocation protein Sec62, putative [Babesia bigemina]